jgi:hypothetical protein
MQSLKMLAVSAVLIAVTHNAATASFAPVFRPTVVVSRATGAIEVDGRLDDAGWAGAARDDRFVERFPGENVEPPVRTEASITYDDDNLYVAFRCYDDPTRLRATMCQRDQYGSDDAVGVLIDTYGDATWAYEFFVNPYGIQRDLMWTSVHGEDAGFDLVWHAAAEVTADGYVVELAVPLAGMRFPDADIQTWRINFTRLHPRESFRQYSWAAFDRNEQCLPCQWGTVEGISGVHPGKGLELLPAFIGYQTGHIADELDPAAGFDNEDFHGEASLGAKYSPTSDITLEAAANPDFSQIEADAAQIDINTTIMQRYPERRPFFQEGNDLFRTMFNSFYTRMINDPNLAAKTTARWDRTSLGLVAARDEFSPYIIPAEERSYGTAPGRSTVVVLRGLRSFGDNSQVGFMATDRRYDSGGSGTILAGDFNLRLSNTLSWASQYVASYSREPEGVVVDPGKTFDHGKHTVDLDGESYSGAAFITELRHRSRNLNVTFDYNQLDPTYRTQTGYDPWNDQRNAFVYAGYTLRRDSGLLESATPNVFVDGRWNMDGQRKWRHANAQFDLQMRRAQTHLGVGYSLGQEMWGGVKFDDLWTVFANLDSRPHDAIGFYLSVRTGRNPALSTLGLGDETGLSAALELKPFDRLIIEPTIDHVRSKNAATGEVLFEQTIARARLRLQVNPRLSLRLVAQYGDTVDPVAREYAQAGEFPGYHMYYGRKWEIDPLLTYRLNSFSVFYLGSTHDLRDFNAAYEDRGTNFQMTDRQFFTKIQYLLQI